MSRQRIAIGQWGHISSKQVTPGRFRAWQHATATKTAKPAPSKRSAPAAPEAETRLRAALHERAQSNQSDITPATDIATLSALWLAEIEAGGEVLPQTLAQYRTDVEKTICAPHTGIAGVTLREATTSRLDRFIKRVSAEHPAKARRIKTILSQMLGLAVRHDALDTNPVREVARIKGTKKNVRALTLD